jgi:hypothetical protein
MFRRFLIAASIMILFGSAAARAQDRNAMPTLNQAIRSRWLQFSIVGGRITLDGSQVGNININPNTLSQREQLSIRVDNGESAMTYEWSNAKEQLNIDVSGGNRVHLRRAPKKDAETAAVDFTQKPLEKAVFTLETAGNKQVFTAAGVWHLFILYPQESRKYLAPLAQTLQPNWKLAELADSVENELLRNAENHVTTLDRSNWARWVAQLGDDNFARRQAADRALRSADPVVLVYLQQLDLNRLDAEQQFRIRRIIEALSQKINDDSAAQVASWLAGDPSIWLALLGRPDASTRRIAAKQLAALLEGPIPVDPEADPASQKTQFEQLRARIEAKAEFK